MKCSEALVFTLHYEGGYSNNPNDSGGETNFGITHLTYDSWRIKNNLPKQSVKLITQDEVSNIYKTMYWDKCYCDLLPNKLDLVIFDFGVNAGPSRSVQRLQKILGVVQDGSIGPKSLAAITSLPIDQLITSCLEDRKHYYQSIVEMNPKNTVFLKGWLNRVEALRQFISKL